MISKGFEGESDGGMGDWAPQRAASNAHNDAINGLPTRPLDYANIARTHQASRQPCDDTLTATKNSQIVTRRFWRRGPGDLTPSFSPASRNRCGLDRPPRLRTPTRLRTRLNAMAKRACLAVGPRGLKLNGRRGSA